MMDSMNNSKGLEKERFNLTGRKPRPSSIVEVEENSDQQKSSTNEKFDSFN